MNEQVKALQQHLMNAEALIVGSATRIPEELRDAITKEIRSALAITIAAEAMAGTINERRAPMKALEGISGLSMSDNGDIKFTGTLEMGDGNSSPSIAIPFAAATWVASATVRHVWHNQSTDKWHFSDEAEQMDATPYDSEQAAEVALIRYIAEHLDPPNPEATQQAADSAQGGATAQDGQA